MSRTRSRISENSKWYISAEATSQMVAFSYRYQEYKDNYESLQNTARAINYDPQPKGTRIGRPTEEAAIRASKEKDKIKMIEDAVRETTGDTVLYRFLLRGVTDSRANVEYLISKGMPYEKTQYYAKRREYLWRLSKKFDERF